MEKLLSLLLLHLLMIIFIAPLCRAQLNPSDSTRGVLLTAGEGKSLWVLGDSYTFKVTGSQTNGAFTIIDHVIQPESGPPPHVHQREDEAFYVLEGRFSFLCGNKETIFEAGSFVYVPKGTLHTFKNVDERQGRLLAFISPAGLEEFFYAIGTPVVDLNNPPAFDPAVMEEVMKLAKDYQIDIVPPGAE